MSLAVVLLATIANGCADLEQDLPAPPTKSAMTESAVVDESAVDIDSEKSTDADSGSMVRKAIDGLAFIVPGSWKEMPLSQFQRGILSAKYAMPEAGDDVTLTLSRASGGLDSNLDRWRGQFSLSREEIQKEISLASTTASLIDLQGEFSPGFGKEADGEWRMIGVVVPLPQQSYFMKLTGPVDQVASVEEDFLSFAKSAARE